MKRASGAVTLHAGGIPRATLIGNDNSGCTRSEDPGPSHWLREERATSPPVPHAERREDAACSFTCPLSGSRRTPQDGTCTAPTLGAGWCRVTPTSRGSTVSSVARLLQVFDRLPTGSSVSSTHGPSGHPASRHRRDSSKRGRRPLPTPPTGGYHPHARKRRVNTIGVRAITRTFDS